MNRRSPCNVYTFSLVLYCRQLMCPPGGHSRKTHSCQAHLHSDSHSDTTRNVIIHIHACTNKKTHTFQHMQKVHRHLLDCMTGAVWDSCSVHRFHPSSQSSHCLNSPNCSYIPSSLQFRGSCYFSKGIM